MNDQDDKKQQNKVWKDLEKATNKELEDLRLREVRKLDAPANQLRALTPQNSMEGGRDAVDRGVITQRDQRIVQGIAEIDQELRKPERQVSFEHRKEFNQKTGTEHEQAHNKLKAQERPGEQQLQAGSERRKEFNQKVVKEYDQTRKKIEARIKQMQKQHEKDRER